MNAYLRERDLLEHVISDEFADLGKRVDAIATLLQQPISGNLRIDLKHMYLDFCARLDEVTV